MFLPFQSPSIIWVPCIPDYSSGNYIPVYNVANIPPDLSNKIPVLPRGGIKTKPWTHEEDIKLMGLVEKFGVKKWAIISNFLNEEFSSNRKGKNCRERWNNHLNPSINKGEWTYEEDLKLLLKHKELGRKWSMISKELAGRTENAVKNRWNTLMKGFMESMQNRGGFNADVASDCLINHLKTLIASE